MGSGIPRGCPDGRCLSAFLHCPSSWTRTSPHPVPQLAGDAFDVAQHGPVVQLCTCPDFHHGQGSREILDALFCNPSMGAMHLFSKRVGSWRPPRPKYGTSPNLQYPQRLPLTLDRRGSPAVCLDSSNRLFICRATSPPPPPANRIRPTTVLIWILYFASGMVNQEGRPTQHPVLLSPFAKPYLFHVLFFFLLSFPSLPLPLPLPPPPSAHRAFLPSPVSLSAASGLFLLFSSFPTKASARVGILGLL